MAISAYRFEATVAKNVFVDGIPVGGLSPTEAQRKIRIWWEAVRINALEMRHPKIRKPIAPMTPGALGVLVDDVATVAQLPLAEFIGSLKDKLTSDDPVRRDFAPKFKAIPADLTVLKSTIHASVGDPHPARARFVNGQVEVEPEVSGFQLEQAELFDAVVKAVLSEQALELPLSEAPKHFSDESLSAIKEVVSEFGTNFSASNRPRSANIKLAQSKINGTILGPGDVFSYNNTVGPRTLKAGFQLAGIYKNGRHDTGIGGGICQVSTTLYNTALFADLSIRQRLNHSLPVPYVPLGRDATVDYGRIDLLIQNTYATPIAIAAEYRPGHLTFRVLGTKDPSLSIKLTADEYKSWPRVTKTIPDPTVPPGKQVLVDKGCDAFSIRTYRRVFKNGQLVRTDSLGRSHYPGGPKIVAVGAPIPIAGVPGASSPPAGSTPPGVIPPL